ncbi:MAG: class I SAM-dependent methyltransferase [Rhodospirillales bacterium]
MSRMTGEDILRRLYPELDAGGFSHDDQLVTFFTRVRALLPPGAVVMDFGAGRGKSSEIPCDYKRDLVRLRETCARYVGVDIDEVVLQNPLVDEAVVVAPLQPFPFEDASFDMIVSLRVFEHVARPDVSAAELDRVLRPGGWICALTPNKWGYMGMAARLLPEHSKARLLAIFAPARKIEDHFVTRYRMNTRRALRRLFPEPRFSHHSYVFGGPPAAHANSLALARLAMAYEWLMPPSLRKSLHVFIRKNPV